MFGIRKLIAKLKGSDGLQKAEHIVIETIGRAGLKPFLAKYENLALDEFAKLAALHGTADVSAWFADAEKAVADMVKSDAENVHQNWAGILFRLALEAYQAHKEEGA